MNASKETPGPKTNKNSNNGWTESSSSPPAPSKAPDVWLSPTPTTAAVSSWTTQEAGPPGALRLTESDDDISPTSSGSIGTLSPSDNNNNNHFSFATPRQQQKSTKQHQYQQRFFFTPAAAIAGRSQNNTQTVAQQQKKQKQRQQQHGYLVVDPDKQQQQQQQQQPQSIKSASALSWLVAFWIWGAISLSCIIQENRSISGQDPIPTIPPPNNSPSAVAREAFAKLYKRDWGAEPSLWIMLDASTSKRVSLTRNNRNNEQQQQQQQQQLEEDSYSFTDDSSVAYEQGKHFCFDLTDFLERTFQNSKGTPSVRITSYYSLQEQGLDYIARHLVTPDGSKTLVQIEYIQQELGGTKGVQNLKKRILDFAKQNQPSYLDIQYTGRTWSGPSLEHHHDCYSLVFLSSIIPLLIGIIGLLLHHFVGIQKAPLLPWGVMASASMATTSSASAIPLSHLRVVPSSQMTFPTLLAISSVLSFYFSKLQADNRGNGNEAREVFTKTVRSGAVLSIMFVTTFFAIPWPTIQVVCASATVAVVASVCFHILLVPRGLGFLAPNSNPIVSKTNNNANTERKDPLIPLIVAVCVTAPCILFLAYQACRLNGSLTESTIIHAPGGGSNFHSIGESMGHGRLTPYRILFDGHQRNISMVSLNGYDIMQMAVDELRGISLSETSDNDTAEESPELLSGSTHVGESFQEVQHLIKNLVRHLTLLREEQQREFDLHHKRRQKHWEQQQDQEESDIEDFRCDYNINKVTTYSGIATLENLRIPQALYNAANICRGMEPRCPSEALHLLNVLEDETTTSDHMATFVTVNLAVDPFSQEGSKWLTLARETIQRLQVDPRILGGVDIHIAGPAAEYHDGQQEDQVRMLFPHLPVVAVVTMVALAICHGSVFASLRSLAIFGVAFSVSFGAVILICDDDVLNQTRIATLESSEGEYMLDLPIVCLLSATIAVLSEITLKSRRAEQEKSLMASTKLVALFLLFLSCFSMARVSSEQNFRWPMLVSATLFAVTWVRKLLVIVEAMAHFLCFKSPCHRGELERQSALRCIEVTNDRDQEKQNRAYLVKFEELLKSPQAP